LNKKAWYAVGLLAAVGVGFGLFRVVDVFYPKGSDGDILVRAFNTSGAAVVEANINAYASDTGIFLDREEVTRIVTSLADGMELDLDGAERIENFSGDYNQLSVTGKNADGYGMVIIVHSMDFSDIKEGPGGFETNIVIDTALDGDIKELPGMEERISNLVAEHMQGVRTTSCIVGSYFESIPEDNMEAIIGSVFQSADAVEVERAIYDGFLSVSAYTPRIGDYIQMGGNRINLNVAMRYNSYEGRTYIWLGSPVITMEY
jgi:hypothetical protein